MAATIGWVDANVGATPQKRSSPALVAGGLSRESVQAWAKVAGDGNGTIYFLNELPSDAIIVSALLNNDALTGATSADFGLYKIDKGLTNLGGPSTTTGDYTAGASVAGTPNSTPVDAGAIYMSAQDISAGFAIASEKNLMSNITAQTVTTLGAAARGILALELKLWELLGFTDPKWKEDSYVLGLRLNTAGSAAGNLATRVHWVQA